MKKTKFSATQILILYCLCTLFIVGLGILTLSKSGLNLQAPNNFQQAKKQALSVFKNYPVTFYCYCPFDAEGNLFLKTCGYQSNTQKRINKIEFEHLVPAHRFGGQLSCWQGANKEKIRGRRACQQTSKSFNRMEADLHNLVPAIGEINEARSNYAFTEFKQLPAKRYGTCNLYVDSKKRLIQPNPDRRGTIARAYLYMSARYQIDLSPRELKLFKRWHQEHPVQKWEKDWNLKVASIQGNYNPYILDPSLALPKLAHNKSPKVKN